MGLVKTQKMRRAVRLLPKNKGNVSKSMKEAGYSDTSANSCSVTRTKAFEELLAEELPDELLARTHKEGLRAMRKEHKIVDRDDEGKPIYDFIDVEDYQTRHRYLDTAYKVRNKYPSEKVDINVRQMGELTEDELDKMLENKK